MKSFVVYSDSGQVIRSGSCATEDFALQVAEGEFILEGVADDATQLVIDGVVVDKPEPTDVENNTAVLDEVRVRRHNSLAATDWTQMSDSPFTESQKEAWANYRQELRDLPTTYSEAASLEDVVFPKAPEA